MSSFDTVFPGAGRPSKRSLSRSRFGGVLIAIVLVLSPASALPTPADEPATLPLGVIVDPVRASERMRAETVEQSYAVYLPAAYDRTREWPVLFVFDPRRRGAAAAEVFRQAAEELEWIIVSSNHSRSDEDPQPNIDAMKAMWEDAHGWFSIDPRRVYATGLSGGARIAALLGYARSGEVAGVIGCGAGFPSTHDPAETKPPFLYFGAVGSRDFNFYEVTDLTAVLPREGTRVEVFDGPHAWLPPSTARRAMLWLELHVQHRNATASTAAALAFGSDELARAREVAAYDPLRGVELLTLLEQELASALTRRSSHDDALRSGELERLAGSVAAERQHLESEHRLAPERDRRRRLRAWEEARIETARDAITRTGREQDIPFPRLLAAFDPAGLLKLSNSENRFEADAAERVLAKLRVQTAFYLPRLFASEGDRDRAELMLDVAVELLAEQPGWLHEVAAQYVAIERERKAIAALRRARELGLDAAALDDSRLSPLAGRRRFEALRATPPPP